MADLETRLLTAGAMLDGMELAAWLALRPDEDPRIRARAIAGYPETITDAHALAAEARATAAHEAREAQRIEEEENAAWAEHEVASGK